MARAGRLAGLDADAFFNNYPVRARPPRADVVHIGSQNLATVLLLPRPPVPTVVTVHDIIPYIVRTTRLSTYRTLADRRLRPPGAPSFTRAQA